MQLRKAEASVCDTLKFDLKTLIIGTLDPHKLIYVIKLVHAIRISRVVR